MGLCKSTWRDDGGASHTPGPSRSKRFDRLGHTASNRSVLLPRGTVWRSAHAALHPLDVNRPKG